MILEVVKIGIMIIISDNDVSARKLMISKEQVRSLAISACLFEHNSTSESIYLKLKGCNFESPPHMHVAFNKES